MATMFALPLISGLVAPKAINAASGQENSVNTSDVGESCSTFNNRKGNGELCRASFCISTNSGDSCCTGSEAGSPDIIRPGTSIDNTDPDSQDFKYVVITPSQTPPTCASSYRCCDGSQSSYGTCSYEEQEVASNGWILARLRCRCSCS